MKTIKWESDNNKFQMFDAKRPMELLIIHSQRIVSDYAKNKITWMLGAEIENQDKEILICEEFVIACKLTLKSAKNLQTYLQYFEENQN